MLSEKISIIDEKITKINNRVDNQLEYIESNIDNKIEELQKTINNQPNEIVDGIKLLANKTEKKGNKLDSYINLGPKIHQILIYFENRVGCDHIFTGLLHNGTSSISGMPYYKFDIIAEKFKPDQYEQDLEFANIYKNEDILRHDRLPIILTQENFVYYKIDDNKCSDLCEIDNILYRRLLSRDIKQMSLQLFRDKVGKPTGFVGCISFNYNDMDFKELNNCAKELEKLFNE